MIKELIKLANHLDSKGLTKEADALDKLVKSAFWGHWSKDSDRVLDDNEIVFDFTDRHEDGCYTDIVVGGGAELVEESQTSVSYRWNCVSPDDPFNKSKTKYANITLQFFKTGPINEDEIEEALEGRDRSEYSDIVSNIARYCINEVPNISDFNTRGCS